MQNVCVELDYAILYLALYIHSSSYTKVSICFVHFRLHLNKNANAMLKGISLYFYFFTQLHVMFKVFFYSKFQEVLFN